MISLSNLGRLCNSILIYHIRKKGSFLLSSLVGVHFGLLCVFLEEGVGKSVDMHSLVHLLLGVSHLTWATIDSIDLLISFGNPAVVLSDIKVTFIRISFSLFIFFLAHSFILQILVRLQGTIKIHLLNLILQKPLFMTFDLLFRVMQTTFKEHTPLIIIVRDIGIM